MTFDIEKSIDALKDGYSLLWEQMNATFNLFSTASVDNARLLARDIAERQRITSRALKVAAE